VVGGAWADRLRAKLNGQAGERPVAFATRLRVRGREVEAEGHELIERAEAMAPLTERGRRLLADAFERGVARLVPLGNDEELLVEPIVAPPRLIIAGGGHVAHALATMARLLDYSVTVIDDREDFANTDRFPGMDVIQDDIPAALARLDPGWNTFIVVATRGHKLDAHSLRSAVRTNARYVGLLGSRRKTVLIDRMLRDEGVSEERLRAVHAPIGLDLGGRTPAEIALSILSEMSQERYGGTAKPLRLPAETLERAANG
jgi:xanthine dehydrogenase accessory factor